MTQLIKLSLISFAAMMFVLAGAANTKADPLLFSNVSALQNQGATRVDLFSNPGVTLTGPQISFLLDITGSLPPGVTNMLSITYREAGSAPIIQTFLIPAFGTIQPPFTQLFTITSPGATFQGTLATLTIDIIGSSPDFVIPGGPSAGQRVDSYTFTFSVAKPVPEPATLALLGAGMMGLWWKVRKRGRE